MRLRNPFKLLRRKPKPIVIEAREDVPDGVAYMVNSQAIQSESHGKIVKVKYKPDYKLPTKRPAGGRVVRTMPRNLRKMKEHAENTDV